MDEIVRSAKAIWEAESEEIKRLQRCIARTQRQIASSLQLISEARKVLASFPDIDPRETDSIWLGAINAHIAGKKKPRALSDTEASSRMQ
jgi:hypothetical protein